MIRVRTLRMVSDLRPARLALSGALSRRSRELIEHSRRRMHNGHGWRDESEVEFVEATRDRVWSLTDDQMDLPRAHCS